MAVNDLFKKLPVEVPNRSGFDESHFHLFTAKVGTLVPCMTDMLLPNDTVSVDIGSEIQLPPMATDFYGRVKAHFEAFFVPFRTVYGGWQEFITHNSETAEITMHQGLPIFQCPIDKMLSGSLSDYLGYGLLPSEDSYPELGVSIKVPNPLKYLCYHKIYDDWYRDSRIQSPVFVNTNSSSLTAAGLPYMTKYSLSGLDPVLADGLYLYDLRQRNFGKDYFTNATYEPQQGERASVAFSVEDGAGSISIAALRQANSLQRWLETMNIAGERYGDQIRAQFGVYPADATMQRAIYLGRQVFDVYNKSVYQNDGGTDSSNTNNPFSSVGSKYGSPLAVGNGKLVENFRPTEHGYLMVIFSLVPESIYSWTMDKDFWYNRTSDFPFPLLQGVGDEAVSLAELAGSSAGIAPEWASQSYLDLMHETVFGYQQRYSFHKFKLDKVSGLLKDGENLSSFALQRSFDVSGDAPELCSEFIEIPTDFLDNVAAVEGDVSTYGCWVDAYFNYHKVSTLSAYSIPTLGDLKNTHTEVIPNGGTRL